jgi:hypothetical protein
VSRQYDTQLIESVAVRRRRLREAWLFGAARSRHTLDEGVRKLFASVAVAAVVCAGCVGYAFIQKGKGTGAPVAPSPSAPTASGATTTPSGPPSVAPSSIVQPSKPRTS